MAWRPVAPLPVIQAPQYAYGQGGGKAATGGSSGMPVAFRAYKTTNDATWPNQSFQAVVWDATEFDTAGYYNTSNGRFLPLVAGWYQFNYLVHGGAGSNVDISVKLYKNGAPHSESTYTGPNGMVDMRSGTSDVVYLNGSTDYVDVRAYINGGSPRTVYGGQGDSMFSGFLIAASSIGPTFAARPGETQAMTGNIYQKIVCAVEDFDTDAAYNSSTSRFQPSVPGIYRASGQVTFASPTIAEAAIYKNGAMYKAGTSGSGAYATLVTCLVSLNGTTDYIELWGFSQASQNTHGGFASGYTNFAAEYVRPL